MLRLPQARFLFFLGTLVGTAFFFRSLLVAPGASASFPNQTQALPALSATGVVTRPGGWTVPRARPGSVRHSHDFETVSVPVSHSFQLVFPQLGNGRVQATGDSFQTLIVAANFSNQPANCRVSFFGDDGLPLTVPVDGSSVSSLEFDLGVGQQRQFETSGEGEVLVGWALLESDQPVGGAVVFGLRDGTGALVTEVGVPPADPGSDFTILADSLGETQTGIAFANPGPDPLRVTADLLNAAGGTVTSAEVDLAPHGHLAIFLNQLFQNVAEIEGFLGSIRLRSPPGTPFAAMTLRSTGSLLTSLPTVAPPSPDSTRTRLAFPHVADGVQSLLSITTALVLFNTTEAPSRVTLDFFRSDAGPMNVEIDGVTASSFDFDLPPRGVLKVETRGEGELQAGWARASMDQPLSGSAIFRVFRSAAPSVQGMSSAGGVSRALETEVGVPASPLYRDFRLLADTRGGLNTGLAVANVDPDENDVTTSLRITLHAADGGRLDQTAAELPAGSHRAVFVDQLFPGRDFEGFSGFLSVERILGPPVAAVALRSSDAKLTSTPTLFETHGFAPVIETTPLQNLAGTRPGFSWVLHQNSDDLNLRELVIEIAGVTLRDDLELDPGDEIGSGYFSETAESRTFALVIRQAASDRLEFDTLVADSGGAVPGGSGLIQQQAGQVEIRWSLTDPEPFSRTVGNIDHHFFLLPGVLEAPLEPEIGQVRTELTSVSSSPTEEKPLVRRLIQPLEFVEPPGETGNLEAVVPLFISPNAPVQFIGDNLGEAPTVTFPLQNGETASLPAYRNGDGVLEVQAPVGVAEGLMFADNGNGPGNGYRIHSLFSPVGGLSPGSEDSGPLGQESPEELVVTVRLPARQLALSRFSVELDDTVLDFEALDVGQAVGVGTVRENPFTTLSLALELASVGEDRATIDVRQVSPGDAKIAGLDLRPIEDPDRSGLRIDYLPVEVSLDTVILGELNSLELELRLRLPPLMLPVRGLVLGQFEFFSSPILVELADSELQVRQFAPLLIPEGTP